MLTKGVIADRRNTKSVMLSLMPTPLPELIEPVKNSGDTESAVIARQNATLRTSIIQKVRDLKPTTIASRKLCNDY